MKNTCATIALLWLFQTTALAQNVDLVTLPNRDTVQLTIYNSEDLTLAKETRFVTLKKGANRLQFSWTGTLIDPTSVAMRVLEHADKINVVDTTYPGQKPEHLIWNIQSEIEGQVPVEVSYFTSGLTWQMDYVAVVNPAETNLNLQGYVRVLNSSGEAYENAQIRLIVGKINLVEKIAKLAKQRGLPDADLDKLTSSRLRQDATRESFGLAFRVNKKMDSGQKTIVKEGLSEYFMFTVEGSETIRNGWSKRMRAVHAEDAGFEIAYRMRAYQYGPRPVRFFVWRNDPEHHLGESPLPNGVIRVFRQNGREGLSYLGQQSLNYVPIKAEIEVNLGHDDLVVFQRRRTATSRSNFTFHPKTNHVTGWNEQQDWVDTLRNYRGKPIRFELRHRISGDVEFSGGRDTKSFDFNTIEAKWDVPASEKSEFVYRLLFHHGTNAKQNRVRVIPPQ